MMNQNELNKYIKHYVTKDKTNRAIMLSAPWGTGKSYYIKNCLIPYLQTKNKIKCIVVSLYGLKDISEISKSIFLETKLKIKANSLGYNTGKVIAKTIAKGIASFFGIDLSMDEKALKNIYKSINLSNTLIILEDVERSTIDILEILGFVNSLVEQDGVKVLLVANENEIIDTYNKNVKESNIAKYLRIKEKTIGDTISFYVDLDYSIGSIIKSFDIKYISENCNNELISEIRNIMIENKTYNLRSVIYACQKTIDMFEFINFDIIDTFFISVFLANIAFCLKKDSGMDIKWPKAENISNDLGTYDYPLHKFSYDYICYQTIDTDAIKKSYEYFIKRKNNEIINNELKSNLDIIYSYYICKESDVKNALNFVSNKLENTNDIPSDEYGKLANYLIAIKADIRDCSDIVDKCKHTMLSKISEVPNEVEDEIINHSGFQLETSDAILELKTFESELYKVIEQNNKNKFIFSYSLNDFDNFCEWIKANKDSFIKKRCFATKIDNQKLALLIEQCSAYQIYKLRLSFHNIYYSFSNIKDFFKDDRQSILDLAERLKQKVSNSQFDAIQKKQLNYFIGDLNNIADRLN